MKYKIVLLVGLLFIGAIFALFVRRSTYYSNLGEKTITEKDFSLECKLGEDKETIKVYFLYKNNLIKNIDEQLLKQLSILPIVNHTDTLKFLSVNASLYNFSLPSEKLKKLDLFIKYQVDSAGLIINKSKRYYNLEKVYTYRFNGALH